MSQPTPHASRPATLGGLLAALMAALLAACSTPPPPPPVAAPKAPPAPRPAPPAATAPAVSPLPPGTKLSAAVSAQDYRKDGARHIYAQNGHRIYKGKMPPLLQGVGVMQMDIDGRGQIVSMSWLRPPSHSGARAEIERTARAAAPYPVPQRLGRVTYTDTWLWDKSGQFQLDTLTEGQRDR
ncbi:hypothetical protein [Hydrogenophaga sp.]|uniref:hypothetical protein n=1 Tax=Hydrogenophaga sp. TaxID=1904254 RepID=UPI00286E0C1E|nr:hypothetical protein [Hydrogenophaga sp.]